MSAYSTRYRGQRVPTTVEMEAKNNACLGKEEEEEESLALQGQRKKKAGASAAAARRRAAAALARRRTAAAGADDDDEYNLGEEDDDDDDSDPEYATAKALVMQRRGPGPPAPFRWATVTGPPPPPLGGGGGGGVPGMMTIPSLIPPSVPEAPLGGGTAVHLYPTAQRPRRGAASMPAPATVGPHGYHAVKQVPTVLTGLPMIDDGKRNTWTADEDKILASLVAKYGPKKWGVVATYLPLRNAKQCHQRWHYVLKPSISRETWTEREDYIIYHYQRLLGNKWSHIAKYLPGRTGYAVRNRHSFLLKNYKDGKVPSPPGESLPTDTPKSQGKPIRRTNNSLTATLTRKMKKIKKAKAAAAAAGLHVEVDEAEAHVHAQQQAIADMQIKAEGANGGAANGGGGHRVGHSLRVAVGDTDGAGGSLMQNVPVAKTPLPAFPGAWSNSPMRSPLDLLASLPQVDLMQLPLPSPSPRATANFFDTHFPNLASPPHTHMTQQQQQQHPHGGGVQHLHQAPPTPHNGLPSLPTPLSSGPHALSRHPLETFTSPRWAAMGGPEHHLHGMRGSFESPLASPRDLFSRHQPFHAPPSSHLEEGEKKKIGEEEEEEGEGGSEGGGGKVKAETEGPAGVVLSSHDKDASLRRHRMNAQKVIASWDAEEEDGEEPGMVVGKKRAAVEEEGNLTGLKSNNDKEVEEEEEEDDEEEDEEDDEREYCLQDIQSPVEDEDLEEEEEEEEDEEEEEEEEEEHYHVKRPKL